MSHTLVRTGREIRLAQRPQGRPSPEDFVLATAEVPKPAAGEVLVRNLVMSVDPYMRGRMNDVPSYVAPFALNEALDGGAVGEVVESHADALPVGTLVLHGQGWRDYAVGPAERFGRLHAGDSDQMDPEPSAYLGVLGMPGRTAYAGLLRVAEMKEGDVVFVSGAAGAVGGLVGQIAKLKGASRVIGSAGSAAKVDYLVDTLGFDAAFNYKDAPVRDQLVDAAPDGIDVYFDNVGGDHLEGAISAMRVHGRAALCGAITQYNAERPSPGPSNLAVMIGKRLTLRGFLVQDHEDLSEAFLRDMRGWLHEGAVRFDETVVDGLENAPSALIGLLDGANTGKMIVRIAD
jgi:NADPH-dependent curcumin reductase CurA